MNFLKKWFVLCWNIRGLNAKSKQLALMNAINNSGCSVICLQETKRRILIWLLLKLVVIVILMNMFLYPQLVPLEG
jgi:hypothetical protein